MSSVSRSITEFVLTMSHCVAEGGPSIAFEPFWWIPCQCKLAYWSLSYDMLARKPSICEKDVYFVVGINNDAIPDICVYGWTRPLSVYADCPSRLPSIGVDIVDKRYIPI